MSLQTDLITALSSVASGQVYSQFVPEKDANGNEITPPFVVYRILNKNPLSTLQGAEGETQYSVAFECYATTLSGALTLADAVRTAIEASSLEFYPESSPGEDYEVAVDIYMEPVYYGFWA